MNTPSKQFVLLSAWAVVLLVGQPAANGNAKLPPQAVCSASTATVPAEYLFYHSLVASHPGLFDPRSSHAPCPTPKVIRT